MKAPDFIKTFGSNELPWFHLFQLDVRRQSIADWVREEPHVEKTDGLPDADYFAVEFDCGLIVSFECADIVIVVSTEPVLQHVRRHLAHWEPHLGSVFDDYGTTSERRAKLDQYGDKMPHLLEPDCYQLMRQGDDGNQFPIGEPTSKLDASCWMAELEARGHKQTYWIVKR